MKANFPLAATAGKLDLDAYLARIGVRGPLAPTLDTLAALAPTLAVAGNNDVTAKWPRDEAARLAAQLRGENRQPLAHALHLQPHHHHRRLFHPLRALVRLTQVQRREVEDRRLLVDRAAVRQHRLGRQLQLHVVVKAQRLQQPHLRVELRPGRIHPLLRARMGRHDHRQAVVFRHRVEHRHQLGEGLLGFDVLFTVRAHHEVAPRLQRQTL